MYAICDLALKCSLVGTGHGVLESNFPCLGPKSRPSFAVRQHIADAAPGGKTAKDEISFRSIGKHPRCGKFLNPQNAYLV